MKTCHAAPALLFTVALLAGCDAAPPADMPQAAQERKPLYYRNPMDPAITSAVPRKDSMGMDYIPVYAENANRVQGAQSGLVELPAAMVANLGIRTAAVRRGAAGGTFRTVGTTAFDERGLVELRVRTEGFVERLAVRAPGEAVRRGQLLFEVYSPRLAAAEREFSAALAMKDAVLADAAAARLRVLGLDLAAIERLRAGHAPGERVRYYAPVDGVVIELGLREGGLAEPGKSAMSFAPIYRLWVVAEIPERLATQVTSGMDVVVRIAALPGRRFDAQVLELLPAVRAETRTRQARIALANPEGLLAAGMVAEVSFAGRSAAASLLVPLEALIRTGSGERIVVAKGEGRFAVRNVISGRESGDEIEIRAGLEAGEQVVVSGQFLIDSESQLRSGLARFEEGPAP